MSGNIPAGHVLGAFMSPFMVRTDPVDGDVTASIVGDLLNSEPFDGTTNADSIFPGVTDAIVNADQVVIGGRVPVYGMCLHLVIAAPATLNALDAFDDVYRITGDLTQAQRTSIEARAREKGMLTLELTGTNSTREMAGRIARILRPGFDGFTTEPFASAFPD